MQCKLITTVASTNIFFIFSPFNLFSLKTSKFIPYYHVFVKFILFFYKQIYILV